MSVSLKCPNCGASVGEASHKDNYKYKYYYKGDDGNPICKNCSAGGNYERNLFIFVLVAVVVVITISIGYMLYI